MQLKDLLLRAYKKQFKIASIEKEILSLKLEKANDENNGKELLVKFKNTLTNALVSNTTKSNDFLLFFRTRTRKQKTQRSKNLQSLYGQ